jgi:hypothetical protein
MKQNHKSVLKRLINGPRDEKSLTHGGDLDLGNAALHVIRNLEESQALGYCVKVGEEWMLTNAGKTALNVKAEPKQTRITSWSVGGVYKGEDLRRLANRPGCYEFLNIPSRMHFGLVYRKDAQCEKS